MKVSNIITKIKAIFNFKGESIELDLSSAKIRQDKVFLRPTEDPEHIYSIKANEIVMFIDPESEVQEENIDVIDVLPNASSTNDNSENTQTEEAIDTIPETEPETEEQTNYSFRGGSAKRSSSNKKRFSVTLYEDEYEMIMKIIEERGYKKAEYFLACMFAAKKKSMEYEYKKYYIKHAERRKIEREEAQKAKLEIETKKETAA